MKFSRLIFANLFRKKVRLILTIGSFAIALVLFTFLAVVKSAFSRGTEIAGADRLIVVSRIGLMQLLPISYRDKILAIPGVKAVTHNHWFGGVYQDEKNFFPQFVIDPENQRQVMTELVVPDDQWNIFLKDRLGAIAGARTAERFHWKIGDRIPIKTTLYGGGASEFNLDGIYHSERAGGDESQFWLQWKYFDENVPSAVKSTAGWYVVKLDSPDDAVRVAKAIDEKFANSSFETKSETESAFLKAIGFSGRAVLFFVLAESVIIALVGGFLGLTLAYLAMPIIGLALTGLLPPLILSKSVLTLGLGFALLVGAASGLLPGIGAMRMRVVNALRRVCFGDSNRLHRSERQSSLDLH